MRIRMLQDYDDNGDLYSEGEIAHLLDEFGLMLIEKGAAQAV